METTGDTSGKQGDITASTSPPPLEEKDSAKYYVEEIESADPEAPRPKESEQCMRNKNERKGNILSAELINLEKMPELVENALGCDRNTLEWTSWEKVNTL